jgi:hypothetical protein
MLAKINGKMSCAYAGGQQIAADFIGLFSTDKHPGRCPAEQLRTAVAYLKNTFD